MTSTTAPLLKRLLFPANSPAPERRAPHPINGTTVFFRIRLRENVRPVQIKNTLNVAIPAGSKSLTALAATQVYLYTDATHRGFEIAPFIIARTHRALTLVSRLGRRPEPPMFNTDVRPQNTALLEFQFPGSLNDKQRTILRSIEESLAEWATDISINECDTRYTVVDSTVTRRDAVFLTVVTRVPWNQTLESAQRYWINEHASLVSDNLNRTNMVGYIQVHTARDSSSPFRNEFGGVATIEFDGIGDYLQQIVSPTSLAFNNTLVLDEMNLTIGSEIYLFHREDALKPAVRDA